MYSLQHYSIINKIKEVGAHTRIPSSRERERERGKSISLPVWDSICPSEDRGSFHRTIYEQAGCGAGAGHLLALSPQMQLQTWVSRDSSPPCPFGAPEHHGCSVRLTNCARDEPRHTTWWVAVWNVMARRMCLCVCMFLKVKIETKTHNYCIHQSSTTLNSVSRDILCFFSFNLLCSCVKAPLPNGKHCSWSSSNFSSVSGRYSCTFVTSHDITLSPHLLNACIG